MIVSADVPGAADEVELKVRVELPPEVTEAGLNVPVTPAGKPETLKVTLWVAPLVVVVLTAAVTEFPATSVPLAGERVTPKSLAGAGVVPASEAPLGVPRPVGPSYPAPALHR